MRNRLKVLALVALALAGVGSWLAFSEPSRTVQAQKAEPARPRASGILDGMTFAGRITRDGWTEDTDVLDKWVFENGMFESTECSKRCNYPRAPYFIRRRGETVEFISESHCLDKDSTIVWRGTIDGSSIKGEMVWTSSRWYWTIEKTFDFEGTLTEGQASVAGK